MNNLSLREKTIMYILVLVVIGLLAYLFGIRTLNNKNADLQVELQNLEQRKADLDALKKINEDTKSSISTLRDSIVAIEQSFISDLKTENAERYVLDVLEKSNMPFLAKVEAEDVTMQAVVMADGSISSDAIRCKRINIEYASTDGYEITQYNLNPNNKGEDGKPNAAYINQMLAATGKYDAENHYGYDEFIAALKKIEVVDPDCVKITDLGAKSTHGYLTLTASIDFYGADLTNRISEESDAHKNTIYAAWSGDAGIDTKGGFIGMPYKVDNPDSLWDGVIIDPSEVDGFLERPFAAYLSNARFTKLIAEKGIAAIVGGGVPSADSGAAQANNQDQANNAA